MKKILFSFLALSVVLSAPAFVYAKSDKKADSEKQVAHAKKEADRHAELENKEWSVTLYKSDAKGKASSPEKGTLTFKAEKLTFNGFKSFSYGPIGYTMTAYDDNDKGTWESFLGSESVNTSVRGDWTGTIMNGIISEAFDGGKTVVNSRFTSVNEVKDLPKEEEKTPEEIAKATAPAEAAPVALVSKEAPTAKKK